MLVTFKGFPKKLDISFESDEEINNTIQNGELDTYEKYGMVFEIDTSTISLSEIVKTAWSNSIYQKKILNFLNYYYGDTKIIKYISKKYDQEIISNNKLKLNFIKTLDISDIRYKIPHRKAENIIYMNITSSLSLNKKYDIIVLDNCIHLFKQLDSLIYNINPGGLLIIKAYNYDPKHLLFYQAIDILTFAMHNKEFNNIDVIYRTFTQISYLMKYLQFKKIYKEDENLDTYIAVYQSPSDKLTKLITDIPTVSSSFGRNIFPNDKNYKYDYITIIESIPWNELENLEKHINNKIIHYIGDTLGTGTMSLLKNENINSISVYTTNNFVSKNISIFLEVSESNIYYANKLHTTIDIISSEFPDENRIKGSGIIINGFIIKNIEYHIRSYLENGARNVIVISPIKSTIHIPYRHGNMTKYDTIKITIFYPSDIMAKETAEESIKSEANIQDELKRFEIIEKVSNVPNFYLWLYDSLLYREKNILLPSKNMPIIITEREQIPKTFKELKEFVEKGNYKLDVKLTALTVKTVISKLEKIVTVKEKIIDTTDIIKNIQELKKTIIISKPNIYLKGNILKINNITFSLSTYDIDHMKSLYLGNQFQIDLACMLLRYKTFNNNIDIPEDLFSKINSKYKIDAELFINPIQSHTSYYSLFPDTDTIFSSKGNALDIPVLEGIYLLYMPQTSKIIEYITEKITKLINTDKSLIFIIYSKIKLNIKEIGVNLYYIGSKTGKEIKF